MKEQNKITFLGGDARQGIAALKLSRFRDRVSLFAGDSLLDEKIDCPQNLEEAIEEASGIILPLPASIDGITLNAPIYDKETLKLEKIIDTLSDFNKNVLLIGGRIPVDALEYAERKGIRVIDYFLSEAFQIKNAYITAEAALSVAMNNIKKSIKGAQFAITGYGRIAKALCDILLKLGGEVCVLARKESDIAWAELNGAKAKKIRTESLREACREADVIFNTVPKWLFYEEELLKMGKKTQIIDLASSPGGVDLSAVKRLGSKVLWASSLPGKYAPESAGELIAECVIKILEEEGI